MRRSAVFFVLVAAAALALLWRGGGGGGRVQPYASPAFPVEPVRWLGAAPVLPGRGEVLLVEVWHYG